MARQFTSKGIGAQIGAAERLAGVTKREVSTKALGQAFDRAVTKDLKQTLNLTTKGQFSDITNSIVKAIQNGAQFPRQFLSDAKVAMEKALNTRAFSQGTPKALMVQKKKIVDAAFDDVIPKRANLARRFSNARQAEEILAAVLRGTGRAAVKAGKGAAILGAAALGGRGIASVLSQ